MRVLITGANRGIGLATAMKFLSEGWDVIGSSRTGFAAITHEHFHDLKLDVSCDGCVREAAEFVENDFGKIDVLINNAGVLTENETDFGDMAAIRTEIEVNLIGLIEVTQRFLPLINDGGQIINLSSMTATLTEKEGTDYPGYRISKAGVNMYTHVLAQYLAPRKITVSSVDPGWVNTDMGGKEAPRTPETPAIEIFDLVNTKHESGLFWFAGKPRSW